MISVVFIVDNSADGLIFSPIVVVVVDKNGVVCEGDENDEIRFGALDTFDVIVLD
jgi:hypothetical protein